MEGSPALHARNNPLHTLHELTKDGLKGFSEGLIEALQRLLLTFLCHEVKDVPKEIFILLLPLISLITALFKLLMC